MTRRCLRLAALALGLLMAAAPAAAGPASAAGARTAAPASRRGPAHPWIAITSMTPTTATPKRKVTVSGIVANPEAAALPGLTVGLWSSAVPLVSRTAMNGYLTSQTATGLDTQIPGAVRTLPAVPAHGAVPWSLTLDVAQVGMRYFGVYPLAAQLNSAVTGPVDVARTLLPFWPGKSALRSVKPLAIGWAWPVIDTPQQDACPGLVSNELAGSIAAGGRLNTLLAAGQSADGVDAQLTWAIDPALLSDLEAMRQPYRAGSGPDCAGGTPERASHAAAAWLSGIQEVTRHQDFFVTPYADADIAALAHKGLDSELGAAFTDGRATAQKYLGGVQRATPDAVSGMAWPSGGIADYSVLQELAAHQQVRAVILDSRLMPPRASVNYTPTAVTTTPDGLGAQMNVLLADHTLTQILTARRSQIPGVVPAPPGVPSSLRGQVRQAAAFGKEQWFLAETAMIAAEPAPRTPRAVVVAPPRRWDPSLPLVQALLAETTDTPWLHPATLASMVAAGAPPGQPARQSPPQRLPSSDELSASLLRQVKNNLDFKVRLLDSILTAGGRGYLSTAVDAVESSAWRGGRAAERPAEQMLRRDLDFVETQLRQVRIVGSPRVTLGGKAGNVPVSIRNNLPHAVTVRLHVSVTTPSVDHVTIGWPFNKAITVQGKAQVTVKIPVQAQVAGSTTLTLWLATPQGVPLPGKPAYLTVTATHFGTLAIVIITVALVVFVFSAAARAIRRGGPQEGGAGLEAEELDPMPSPRDPASGDGEPGSVGPGRAEQGQPAEEDDDHATAPGRADRR